jgi:glyoxylase I family protein
MVKNKNSVIGGGGFHHVAIQVHDFDASVKFYTEGLGFKEKIRWLQDQDDAIMLDTGDGNYLEIFSGGPKVVTSGGPFLHFALRTENCDKALQQAVKAGAVVTMDPRDINVQSTPGPTPIRIAFCKTPDGTVIEFFQNELT